MSATARLRLALAQVNPCVGDIAGNAATIRHTARRAAESGAHLVAFPEMMLTGYPVEDLVFRSSFVTASRTAVTASAADLAADGLGDLAVAVGYLDSDGPAKTSGAAVPGKGPRNAMALLHGGRVVATYFKHHLPNYGVFDEDRYFAPGDTLTVVRLGGVDIALTICEDLWQAGGPFAAAAVAERRAGREHQRLAVRAEQGRRAVASGGQAGATRPGPRSPTSTWSAARTSWSSTATRWSSGRTARLSRAHRSSSRDLLVLDVDLPRATTDLSAPPPVGPDGMKIARRPASPTTPNRRAASRPFLASPSRSPMKPRYGGRWCSAWATTCARTASSR